MKGTKRLLIVLLSLMMVFTTMPASFGMAFAEDGTGEGLVDVQEEIQDNADLDQPTGDAAAEETAEPPTDTVTAENAEPAADAEAAEPAPEEVIEEVLPETGASYAVNEEAEALVVHGKGYRVPVARPYAPVLDGKALLAAMLHNMQDIRCVQLARPASPPVERINQLGQLNAAVGRKRDSQTIGAMPQGLGHSLAQTDIVDLARLFVRRRASR